MKDGKNDLYRLCFERSPVGMLMMDGDMQTLACNKKAAFFFEHLVVPEEISSICARVFGDDGRPSEEKLKEILPGEVCFSRIFDKGEKYHFRIEVALNPSPVLFVYILDDYGTTDIDLNAARKQFRLTRRETDIVRYLLKGFDNNHMAEAMGIEKQTVKDHLTHIYHKTGVKNRIALLRLLQIYGRDEGG